MEAVFSAVSGDIDVVGSSFVGWVELAEIIGMRLVDVNKMTTLITISFFKRLPLIVFSPDV